MDIKIQKFYSNSKLAPKSLAENLLSTKVHFSNKEEIFDSNKVLGMESVSCLELAACIIGTRLGLSVAHALDLDKSTITFWTYSNNCSHWINSPSSNLKTFVSNRVGEIHTHSCPRMEAYSN